MKQTREKSVAKYGVFTASKIIGETIARARMWSIQELVIDAGKNRIAYAVLSFGGFMGMGTSCSLCLGEAFEFSASSCYIY